MTEKITQDQRFGPAVTDFELTVPSSDYKLDKKYRVRIFPILETVTSEDCMTFLEKQGAILVGGRGITLLQDQNLAEEFPVGMCTMSFDQKDALLTDSDDYHRVPGVNRYSVRDWESYLGFFEDDWFGDYCLLCFSDL